MAYPSGFLVQALAWVTFEPWLPKKYSNQATGINVKSVLITPQK